MPHTLASLSGYSPGLRGTSLQGLSPGQAKGEGISMSPISVNKHGGQGSNGHQGPLGAGGGRGVRSLGSGTKSMKSYEQISPITATNHSRTLGLQERSCFNNQLKSIPASTCQTGDKPKISSLRSFLPLLCTRNLGAYLVQKKKRMTPQCNAYAEFWPVNLAAAPGGPQLL